MDKEDNPKSIRAVTGQRSSPELHPANKIKMHLKQKNIDISLTMKNPKSVTLTSWSVRK